ncbi:MAG: branched-chain amino acid ABC transporter substrate-binding protein [Deltaproteobacteria bacterium]
MRGKCLSLGARLVLFVVMSALLLYCGEREEKTQGREPTRIGVVIPGNGPLQKEGEMLRLGALMASEEAGSRVRGHKVETIVYHSACDVGGAIPLAERIAADSSISVVIGYLCPETIRAVLPIYRKAHLALINPTVSADYIRSDESRHLFPLLYGDGEQGEFLAAYVKSGLGLSRVAVFSDGSIYGNLLSSFFLDEANRLGLELVRTISANPQEDETAQAVRLLKKAKPEAILLAALPKAASSFLIERRRQNAGGVVLGTDRLAGPDFYELAGQAAEGLLVCQPILLDSKDPQKSEFVRRFEQFSKRSPNWVAVAGFDSMRLALQVLSRSGPERTSFLAAIREIADLDTSFRGLSGPVFFREDGTSHRPFFVAEIHDGRLRSAKPPTIDFPAALTNKK